MENDFLNTAGHSHSCSCHVSVAYCMVGGNNVLAFTMWCLSAEPVIVWWSYNLEKSNYSCFLSCLCVHEQQLLLGVKRDFLIISISVWCLCLVQMWDKLQTTLLVRVSDVTSPRIICIYPGCHRPDYKCGGLGFTTFHVLLIILWIISFN